MYDICADRKDGGALNCPINIKAPIADEQAEVVLRTLCPDVWNDSGTMPAVHRWHI
jgi:hypothetical protein